MGWRSDKYFLVINYDLSKPESVEMIYPIDKEKLKLFIEVV